MSNHISPTQEQLDVVKRAVAAGMTTLPAPKMLLLVHEIEQLRAVIRTFLVQWDTPPKEDNNALFDAAIDALRAALVHATGEPS